MENLAVGTSHSNFHMSEHINDHVRHQQETISSQLLAIQPT